MFDRCWNKSSFPVSKIAGDKIMKTNPLDHIKIASPCSADWNEMRGDDRKRFCSLCELNVYNLSEMTKREAEDLVFQMEGKMCVKFYKRADGTVITKDCPVGLAKVRQKISRIASAAFGLIMGTVGGLWGAALFNRETPQLLIQTSPEISEDSVLDQKEADEWIVGRPEPVQPRADGAINFSVSGGISNGPDIMWIFTERYPKK